MRKTRAVIHGWRLKVFSPAVHHVDSRIRDDSAMKNAAFHGRRLVFAGRVIRFFDCCRRRSDLRQAERLTVVVLLRYTRACRPVRIDISAVGQIRVADVMPAGRENIPTHMPARAFLVKGTTLWSHLLLLRLRLDGGSVRTIVILPDCVPHDSFRVLSVACRWISMRTDKMMEPD